MAGDRLAVTTAIGAAVRPAMPVGFALIFWVCHVVPSSGERILLPRAQIDAIRRQLREVTNKFEILCFKRTIRTEKPARENSFHGFRSIRGERQFGVRVGLPQHGAPEFPLRREDGFVRPDRLRRASVALVVHGSACASRAKSVLSRGESPLQTISFAVKPVPPVQETNLMRRNLACTPAPVRASPVVPVVVSIVWYSASQSALAPLRTRF